MPKPCPICGAPNDDVAAFCDQCGSKLAIGGAPGAAPSFQAPPPYPPSGGGVTCPSCGISNLPGTLFCDQCGTSLVNVTPAPMPPIATPPSPYGAPPGVPAGTGFQQPSIPSAPIFQPPVAPATPNPIPPAPPVAPEPAGGSQPPAACRLRIGGQLIQVPQKSEVIVGRADAASGWNPDVDLTPFGASPESGVSRKHVRLTWQGSWMIEDLDSVNGTFLRGQRLTSHQRTPISNGEMLQLGKLQVTFVVA